MQPPLLAWQHCRPPTPPHSLARVLEEPTDSRCHRALTWALKQTGAPVNSAETTWIKSSVSFSLSDQNYHSRAGLPTRRCQDEWHIKVRDLQGERVVRNKKHAGILTQRRRDAHTDKHIHHMQSREAKPISEPSVSLSSKRCSVLFLYLWESNISQYLCLPVTLEWLCKCENLCLFFLFFFF